MEFKKDILEEVSIAGSNEASVSFAKLSGEKITISVSEVEITVAEKILQKISFFEDSRPVVAYAQMIEEVDGISILAMSREEALNFIDLLNRKPIGTTGVFMDIDRSAIKETLNIISNSYLNALAKRTSEKMTISHPHLVNTKDLKEMFHEIGEKKEQIIVFRSILEIAKHKISAELYLIFSENLVKIISDNN